MAHAEQHFVDRDHLRSHSRWEAQWLVRADDGIALIPGVLAFGLAGAIRQIPPGVLALDLAPYLTWTPINAITLAVPAAIMQNLGLGVFDFEIKLMDSPTEGRTLLAGNIEIRQSVAR